MTNDIFKELGVDLDKLNQEKLKLLNKEMIKEIIERAINKSKPIPETLKFNTNTFTLNFEDINQPKQFEEIFRKSMFDEINNYLSSKGLNPTEYHRIISIEFGGQGIQLTLRF